MAPRRKFDHDECLRLWKSGMFTKAELSRIFNVAHPSIDRIIDPEKYRQRAKDYYAHDCFYCGKPCQWNPSQAGKKRAGKKWRYHPVPRCMECFAIQESYRRTDHPPLDDTLWCTTCKQYKPDKEFPMHGSRGLIARRGRHRQCRPCGTIARRKYRHKHSPPCSICGKGTKDPGSEYCLDCYRIIQKRMREWAA